MDKRVKKMWVEALRSGEYAQTKSVLRRESSFCCLGVLCDLHAKETGAMWHGDGSYLGVVADLPDEVQDWAGLDEACPGPKDDIYGLAEYNDGVAVRGLSFSQIADLIEKEL